MAKVVKSFRVDPEVWARVEREAVRRGVTASVVVQERLERRLSGSVGSVPAGRASPPGGAVAAGGVPVASGGPPDLPSLEDVVLERLTARFGNRVGLRLVARREIEKGRWMVDGEACSDPGVRVWPAGLVAEAPR